MASLSDQAYVLAIRPESLGDSKFKRRHGLKYAYVVSAMANGIASTARVKTRAKTGWSVFWVPAD